jgi:hypothetical protein
LPLSILAACGSSSNSASSGDGGADAPATPDAAPDASPTADAAPDAPTTPTPCTGPWCNAQVVLAVDHVFLGDKDWNGTPNNAAYRSLGMNIDGKVTSRTSTDVCTLAPGATLSAQTDVTNGIDNSYGSNILPVIVSTSSGAVPDDDIDGRISKNGAFTMLIALNGVGGANPTAAMLGSGPLGHAPAWDGSDAWPIDRATLVGGDTATPRAVFSQVSTSNGDLVLAPASGDILLPLPIFPGIRSAPHMPLTHAQLTLTLAPDNKSVTKGVLSGIIPADAFIAWFKTIAGQVNPALCSSNAVTAYATELQYAPDIMVDGTNAPGVACTGISIGIGFTAKSAKLGDAVTVAPAPDPCVDGGP